MRTLEKQKGMGFLGLIFTLVILGFVIYLAWLIVPAYIGNYSLNATLSTLSTKKIIDPTTTIEVNTTNVVNYLARQFRVNDVSDVPLDSIKVYRKDTNTYEVEINYDVRKNVMGNLDVIMTFKNQVKV